MSLMLNNLFEYPWTMGPDGSVLIDRTRTRRASPFEVVSKKADAYELEEILKLRLKIQARRKKDAVSRKQKDAHARRMRESAAASRRRALPRRNLTSAQTSSWTRQVTFPSGATAPNRLLKSALTEGRADEENRVTEGLLNLYGEWAKIGARL